MGVGRDRQQGLDEKIVRVHLDGYAVRVYPNNMETNRWHNETTMLGKCKCGRKVRLVVESETRLYEASHCRPRYTTTVTTAGVTVWNGKHFMECDCGGDRRVAFQIKPINGTYNENVKCNARCTSATGH